MGELVVPDLQSQIPDLVDFQRRLLIGFRTLYPALEEEFDLLSVRPRRGTIRHKGEEWEFLQHGVGVSFTRVSDGTHVSMHADFFDATQFDEWRLGLFLESRGFASVLDLGALLRGQEASGLIRSVGHRRYQFVGPG